MNELRGGQQPSPPRAWHKHSKLWTEAKRPPVARAIHTSSPPNLHVLPTRLRIQQSVASAICRCAGGEVAVICT